MSHINLYATLGGPDVIGILEAAYRAGWAYTFEPPALTVDSGDEERGTSIASAVSRARQVVQFSSDGLDLVAVQVREQPHQRHVRVLRENVDLNPETLAATLAHIPFEIASIGRLHADWGNPALDPEAYRAPSWGAAHHPMDWAAAFKGAGHQRLVSRRWLKTGPWRLIEGPNDTSVVIFHDLDASPEVALEQARPGHAQIGITDETGFLQIPFNYRLGLRGLYDASGRVLKVVVHGRDVPPRALLEWAAIRSNQTLGPEQPIQAVRFIFMEEGRARAHLPRLWRYEHECWAIVDGEEVRLDGDLVPPGLVLARK